jgi:hypothetical protein
MSDPIASINSPTASSKTSPTLSPYKKIKEDMQALSTALQSGNLSSAQGAFAVLEQDAPSLAAASQNTATTNPRAQALAALGSALQSGNITQAQQAFTALQQTMQGSAVVQGHHHHHHSAGSSNTQIASSQSTNPFGLSSQTSGTGSVLNTQA